MKRPSSRVNGLRLAGVAASILGLLLGCVPPLPASPTPAAAPTAIAAPASPTASRAAGALSNTEAETLASLKKIDEHPLYTMHYAGAYDRPGMGANGRSRSMQPDASRRWACSLFAALGDEDNRLFGRNFDWAHSPAVLLFTDPPNGFAAVSMVDIAYLGFDGSRAENLTDLPLSERQALLNAPFLPFDGMNDQGLVVGMAAVPPGNMPRDPNKDTIGSLMVMRKMLDQARTVAEAIAIAQGYNVDMGGGPPIHYLVADSAGRAALIEFFQGKMIVTPNAEPWHLATNFLRAGAGGSPGGQCSRYDRILQRLADSEGRLAVAEAMDLLAEVSQPNTQWSIVYDMNTAGVSVAMGRKYAEVHTFSLSDAGR